ncbi:Glycogen debranching enzyme [Enhygromyxa salina]|uniref:Glycogen debranching enzyme n=2 Tax=Enhygromyxa salina TaxID=215803 RepID=A0A2S9YEA4_9BACT|nr:Glycogen debranching enzyme [Enhygromyxa salina]
MARELEAGQPDPLGATVRDGGVNFAIVSRHATRVELCTFDAGGHERRMPLPARSGDVHHGFLPGAGPGLVYGFRAHGPYAPREGHRFNPHKLLLDPYAREIVGRFEWREVHFGYRRGQPDTEPDPRDNAAAMLKARVAAPLEQRPNSAAELRVPIAETILYELHVKGLTKQHPEVPEPLRGTYAGLGHRACLDHLRGLGVTTLSLLPVHYCVPELHLDPLGLTNYWGYNTLGFFCPDPRLSSNPNDPSATRAEFRAMVAAVHEAGLEVVLDVVFNHTAEGDERGPTSSFRGLDNALYYRLDPEDRAKQLNWTGCGNTLDFGQPAVIRLVLDSLRYWVKDMGVDGFRFDLAPIVGRSGPGGFDPRSPFFTALEHDPVLARAKLIAEPWDLGPDGYALGRFPGRFLEWNDRFRDGVRRLWLRRDLGRGELARRVAGSSDRFDHGGRLPSASVNFIAAHDGFTLADLLSYARKHNHENGEDNRDGHGHEISCNCGVEGPSEDPQLLDQRRRLARALLATLFVSRGTPMLRAGDELGDSQAGNNNAYCQDNALSWVDWAGADLELLAFVRRLISVRAEHELLRRDSWLRAPDPGGAPDRLPVRWRRSDGACMTVDDWHDPRRRSLAMMLGEGDDAVLVLFNPELEVVLFALPPGPWVVVLDSAQPGALEPIACTSSRSLAAQAVAILARPSGSAMTSTPNN